MGFDAVIKRYFPLVVCLFIGIAAYFQAAGITQLVAASVALDPSAMPVAPPSPPPPSRFAKGSSDDHATNADPILKRNPFDSVTGPLDGKPVELPNASSAPVDLNKDPKDDPACDNVKVLLVVQSDQPEWSFAALAGSDGKSQLRRMGDEFGGGTVYYVGWDRVWLLNGSTRCQARTNNPKAAAMPSAKPSAAPSAKPNSNVPDSISSKIHKVSDNEFNIERSVVEQILENQAELMKSARIVPEKEGDKVVGIRLFGIKSDSLLGTLGLENGDRLSSINGFEMSDPQKALEAYARLRTADHLTVSVNRHGKPMNIDFNIK